MAIQITQNGEVYENNTTITGAPAVRITGADVRFINQVNGQVTSTAAGSAAISIEAAGAEIVNELGGDINAFSASDVAILGSANADSVSNTGSIVGRVDLGGGADIYTVNGGASSVGAVTGGDGVDRIILDGNINNVSGAAMTGFEQLEIGNQVLNVSDFSGFQTVTLEAAGFVTFSDSNNPLADLILTGGIVIVGDGSVFQDVTGTASRDDFEVNSGAITGSVDLAGGNDVFGFTWIASLGDAPSVGGTINGGAGTDQANIVVTNGATIDMTQFVGFEAINTGTFTSVVGNVRLVNADGYFSIAADGGGATLRLADSNSPNAAVTVHGQGNLILEATATIGSIASAIGQAAGNLSFTVTNGGTVLGNVVLSSGNDSYDGRSGVVGGTVFGGDGDDSILAGAGDDRLEGGVGVDFLNGGAGADTLLGGAGNDTLIGGDGIDRTEGGAGNDVYYIGSSDDVVIELVGEGTDVIYSSVSYTLALGSHIELMSTTSDAGTSPINFTGNSQNNAIYGNAGANFLDGGPGNDTLVGRGGDDILLGLAGNDTLIGGLGNDIYYVNGAGDLVIEYTGEGSDVVYSTVSFSLAGGASVEIISTTSDAGTAPIDFTGNELNNTVYGNAGNNRLDGKNGNDTLIGRGGDDVLLALGGNNDILIGGLGNDIYYIDGFGHAVVEAQGEGTDIVYATTSYALGAGAHVEILSTNSDASTATVNLTGNELSNTIYGNAGANVLDGKGGNDSLVGRSGSDTFAFSTTLGGGNIDRILDFDVADDRISLDDAVFAGLALGALSAGAFAVGSSATEADDRVIYNSQTGALIFDTDGVGGADGVQFAIVASGLVNLSANDFVVI